MKTLSSIQQKITAAAKRAGRDPQSVTLVAVSKGQPVDKIRAAYTAGLRAFGENYARELLEKQFALNTLDIEWHFLGHLQKNKVNKILPVISWLHSLDSLELAEAIQQRAEKPLACLLEINLAGEKTKTGLSPEAALDLIPKLKELANIDLRGLMTIPPQDPNPEKSRPYFRKLFLLLKTINDRYLYPKPLTELSMGMSHDFEAAIEEGATIVRIGTAIFGPRTHDS
ncbi:MAG: YggS family pyridoxal phosphate-dependent enzyme [Deltaproteobacteria bacterium]|nr:YggS family pyridoxal phosphate-dependent enzyme [Deltaproteobacteria bacterium]